jgi:biopolymer transport protein ExbD
MAEDRRLLDVWIVETKAAYKAVPFETVANWLQQGRLLGEDLVRPTGTQPWFRIDGIGALAPYVPRAEPQRVEDQAEAMEAVEAEFTWRRASGEDDDDPDMIPLIDISLVLLIFFMMTAAMQAGLFTPIDTPPATHQLVAIQEGTYWVGIDKDTSGQTRYSLGQDTSTLEQGGPDLSQVKERLYKELVKLPKGGEVRINLRGDRKLPYEVIKGVHVEIEQLEHRVNEERVRSKLERIKLRVAGEVSEPAQ